MADAKPWSELCAWLMDAIQNVDRDAAGLQLADTLADFLSERYVGDDPEDGEDTQAVGRDLKSWVSMARAHGASSPTGEREG